jgi:chaperonin GroEL
MAINKKVSKLGIGARESLVKGADYMANAVKMTLGPFGLNFALEKNNEITNDGVTVAREICSGAIHDEVEARGARMMLEAATKTEERGCDGTTTATILAQAIMKEAMDNLPVAGTVNAKGAKKKKPSEVRLQIEKECAEIVKMLEEMAEPIKDEKSLIKSAMVSTGNKELAELLGKTQWELGKDGYIMAEETAHKFCSVERVKGIKIDNGIVSSLTLNNVEKQTLEVKDVRILLTDYVIKDLRNGILNYNEQTGVGTGVGNKMSEAGLTDLILVGRHFEPLAIQQCLDNMKTGFRIYPVNAPYVDQKEVMKDLAAVLGARYISIENSEFNPKFSDLGFVSRLEANRATAIFAGKEDANVNTLIEERVKELKEQYKGSMSDFEKKLLDQRIAQLTNGFAILKIGSITDIDRKFLKRKADDAVGAVRSALQEGVVDGAGQALKQIADSLPDSYLLKNPLYAVHNQIMALAPEGFKIEKWVKDPVKVLRVALEHACSVAANFATAGGVVVAMSPKSIDEMLKPAKPVEEEVEVT